MDSRERGGEMTRDDLKDAIVEAALAERRSFVAWELARDSGDLDTHKQHVAKWDEWARVTYELHKATDALVAHDRAEQERIEKHLLEHAFVPGDPDGWARYTPELCDVCGKSEGEHGKGGG